LSENKMSDIIRSSLEGVKSFTDMQTVIGNAIHTPSGVTVIPVSKVSVGFAGGGVDFGIKKLVGAQNFGSGSGSDRYLPCRQGKRYPLSGYCRDRP